jgi:hypothetical protein
MTRTPYVACCLFAVLLAGLPVLAQTEPSEAEPIMLATHGDSPGEDPERAAAAEVAAEYERLLRRIDGRSAGVKGPELAELQRARERLKEEQVLKQLEARIRVARESGRSRRAAELEAARTRLLHAKELRDAARAAARTTVPEGGRK